MLIRSYAKINLGLHITGKRQDGYHSIDTIFHPVDLFDEITIEQSPAFRLTCSDPAIPADSGNLCWKAAELVRQRCSLSGGIWIDIKKTIPAGAGLGGGSSNAASILKAMPQLYGTSIGEKDLNAMALQLGSDVPFFLGRDSAFGEGRGEVLSYFHLSLPYWVVLINPGIHVSTPWAYQKLSEKRAGVFPVRARLKESFTGIRDIPALTNDFEEVVFEEFPVIRSLKESLVKAGAFHSLMSGSGSSVFGLFEKEQDARQAAGLWRERHFVHLTAPNFVLP